MSRWTRIAAVAAGSLLVTAVFLTATVTGRNLQFVLGGALVNLGYRMQDHLEAYAFDGRDVHDLTPQQIWDEMQRQNVLASNVRKRFPRTPRHPLVAIVACMDARIDTNELVGDTRMYYYVLRTAGSVLDEKEMEMLDLAVENGVKVIVLTTHTDCAAEGAASDPEQSRRYPVLSRAVGDRDLRVRQLLARPRIAERIAAGELLVERVRIDTRTERLQAGR